MAWNEGISHKPFLTFHFTSRKETTFSPGRWSLLPNHLLCWSHFLTFHVSSLIVIDVWIIQRNKIKNLFGTQYFTSSFEKVFPQINESFEIWVWLAFNTPIRDIQHERPIKSWLCQSHISKYIGIWLAFNTSIHNIMRVTPIKYYVSLSVLFDLQNEKYYLV